MSLPKDVRWWTARIAQNRKPATYTCPICGQLLPSMSEHMLLFPEDDHSRRRHAHRECVMRARKDGRLPTRDEWRASQPREESSRPRWLGLLRRGAGR
jgi:hypothetical protein